jgi:hypothetical protein
LPPEAARALARKDAVTVTAPGEARAIDGRAVVRADVRIPDVVRATRASVELSGTCVGIRLRGHGQRRAAVLDVRDGHILVVATARLPAGAARCELRIEAYADGQVDTGSGASVELRR